MNNCGPLPTIDRQLPWHVCDAFRLDLCFHIVLLAQAPCRSPGRCAGRSFGLVPVLSVPGVCQDNARLTKLLSGAQSTYHHDDDDYHRLPTIGKAPLSPPPTRNFLHSAYMRTLSSTAHHSTHYLPANVKFP